MGGWGVCGSYTLTLEIALGNISIGSTDARDWQKLLANPVLHWKPGRSAMALAGCWQAAMGEFPPEIQQAFECSAYPALEKLKSLLVLPEYKVRLPGGNRSSQTDVLVVARGHDALAVVAVEGKVDEPFGPTIGEKRKQASPGSTKRLAFLLHALGAQSPFPDSVRYQLLHRTMSALFVAQQFNAPSAVMLIHSFSKEAKWFSDYQTFATAMGVAAGMNSVHAVPCRTTPQLYLGWCTGDMQFAQLDLRDSGHRACSACGHKS